MTTKRIVYLDAIKVFLTLLVVAHHAGQAYGPTGGVWVIADPNKVEWLGRFFFINASYMMGLYFFISGYFVAHSLQTKTATKFLKDRFLRLGIPLTFFTLCVFLPFNYLVSGSNENILYFLYTTYFYKPPIAVGHLWFVASLLVYSFIYLGLFYFLKETFTTTRSTVFKKRYIVALIIFLTVSGSIVRITFPIDVWRTWLVPVEVAHIPQYLALFFIGGLCYQYKILACFGVKISFTFLAIAILSLLIQSVLPPSITTFWLMESFIEALLCVGISMSIISIFRSYCNLENSLVKAISNNMYGIYLFHLFIVIAFQKLFLTWNISSNIKFILVTFFSLVVANIFTQLLKRIEFLRKVL